MLAALVALSACSKQDTAAPEKASAAPAATAPPADEHSPVTFSSELEFVRDRYLIRVHGGDTGSLLVVEAQRDGRRLGEPVKARLDGALRNAAAVDLDGDQGAEVLVLGGSQGVYAWTFADNAFRRLALPELSPEQANGRKGDDDYSLEGRTLLRRFALEDGRTRSLRYQYRGGQGFVVESATDA